MQVNHSLALNTIEHFSKVNLIDSNAVCHSEHSFIPKRFCIPIFFFFVLVRIAFVALTGNLFDIYKMSKIPDKSSQWILLVSTCVCFIVVNINALIKCCCFFFLPRCNQKKVQRFGLISFCRRNDYPKLLVALIRVAFFPAISGSTNPILKL